MEAEPGTTPERSTEGGGLGVAVAPGAGIPCHLEVVWGGRGVPSLCTGVARSHACANTLAWRSRLGVRRVLAGISDASAAGASRGDAGPGDPRAEPPWDLAADCALLSARYSRSALGARFGGVPASGVKVVPAASFKEIRMANCKAISSSVGSRPIG